MSVFHDVPNLSNEDAMRDALSTFGILGQDQRNMFMTLFSKFLHQRQILSSKTSRMIDRVTHPSEVLLLITICTSF
jgi:hypothetical protein